jgi:hypothetical protein
MSLPCAPSDNRFGAIEQCPAGASITSMSPLPAGYEMDEPQGKRAHDKRHPGVQVKPEEVASGIHVRPRTIGLNVAGIVGRKSPVITHRGVGEGPQARTRPTTRL